MKHFKLMKGVLACLLSLALVVTCFTSVAAKADEEKPVAPVAKTATYDPVGDYLTAGDGAKIVYVLKAEKGNTIKKGAKCFELSATATENTLTAIGAKATTKDVYLYICDKEFEEEGKSINANLVIKAQKAKKLVGVIDYTKVDTPDATDVLSITATDSNKKAIDGATCLWYDEETSVWKDNTVDGQKFKGSDLNKVLEAGGGTILVKMKGDANTRSSKEIKVKIAKQGKAPKVKLDVKKDTLSVKNGMDFAIATKNGDKYEVDAADWKTILPVLKTAKTKEATASIVATSKYLPLDKKEKNAVNALEGEDGKVSYTQYKFKNLSLKTVLETVEQYSEYEDGTDIILAVRTSATNKKPASEISYITIKGQTKAPIAITEEKVEGELVVATSTDFDKKGIVVSEIVNYPGTKKVEEKDVLNTKGFWTTFEVLEGGKNADTNATKYEFAVVKNGDIDNIDWATVSWKAFTTKTKINSKLTTKYAVIGKAASKVTLKAKTQEDLDAATANDAISDSDTVILVRRTGIKGKTVDETVSASAYTKLYVAKIGKVYYLIGDTSVGDVAKKYTVNFAKYDATKKAFEVDSKIEAIVGWQEATKAVSNIELPALENAEYALQNGAAETTKITNGKLGFTMLDKDTTITLDIKEFANVKIVFTLDGTEVANSGLTIANGKINGTGDVAAYVGIEYTSAVIANPTKDGYTVKIGALPEGLSRSDDGKYTFTVSDAKEVTFTVPFTSEKNEG